jgi:hypothetical protein
MFSPRTRRAAEARKVDVHALAMARQQFDGLLGSVPTRNTFVPANAVPSISSLRMRTGAAGRRPLEAPVAMPLVAAA